MSPRTEEEIMKKWKGDLSNPVVSICSITYNHEKFIEEALDSFLMQETDFPFEIVIDDDCSPDGTAKKIEQYAKKYPNIIRANLRQKNVGAMTNFIENMKRARGKYIALCEGDDYWTDPLKLQKQVNIFTLHPNVTVCFHPANEINYSLNQSIIICQHFDINTEVPLKNVILGRGGYMPTASLMFKNNNLDSMSNSFKNAPIGDYFIQMYMASLGITYYINEPMAVYRRNTTGSWTDTQNSMDKKILYNKNMIIALDHFSFFIAKEKKFIYEVMIHYAKTNIYLIKNTYQKIYFLYQTSMQLKNFNKFIYFFRILKQMTIG